MTNNNTPPAAGLGIWADLGIWIAFGSVFGLLFGIVVGGLFDNAGLGSGLGLSLGAGLGVAAWAVFIGQRRNARDDS